MTHMSECPVHSRGTMSSRYPFSADTAASGMEASLAPLVAQIWCPDCRAMLQTRLNQLCAEWSSVKVRSLYNVKGPLMVNPMPTAHHLATVFVRALSLHSASPFLPTPGSRDNIHEVRGAGCFGPHLQHRLETRLDDCPPLPSAIDPILVTHAAS